MNVALVLLFPLGAAAFAPSSTSLARRLLVASSSTASSSTMAPPEELAGWTAFAAPADSASLDFSGLWARDRVAALKPQFNLVHALVARGRHDEAAAEAEAEKPYVQRWKRAKGDGLNWEVDTQIALNVAPRRVLTYTDSGEWWVEALPKKDTVLFGTQGGELRRKCAYLPEPDADGVAHATLTETPRGDVEETRRYLKGGRFVVRRSFWPAGASRLEDAVVSTEFFDPLLKSSAIFF
mmetsp:Transcript_4699/g.11048  ORF Transcript_4699/g.11048 Transcript_4699/m.11048 type:complete len:238 (-) Transcript_4699:77-790(-)